MNDDGDETLSPKVVQLRAEQTDGSPRVYRRTLTNADNQRRYGSDTCVHRGPYLIDRRLATVECGDCGALLNPMFVLEMLASGEAYWNMRQRDLAQYLSYVNKEIETRTRTRCTHCGNMTAIRISKEMPQTWVPRPY